MGGTPTQVGFEHARPLGTKVKQAAQPQRLWAFKNGVGRISLFERFTEATRVRTAPVVLKLLWRQAAKGHVRMEAESSTFMADEGATRTAAAAGSASNRAPWLGRPM